MTFGPPLHMDTSNDWSPEVPWSGECKRAEETPEFGILNVLVLILDRPSRTTFDREHDDVCIWSRIKKADNCYRSWYMCLKQKIQ